MTKFRNQLFAATGGLALIGLTVLAIPRTGHATGGPVPVVVSGTTAVADVDNPDKNPFQYTFQPHSSTSNTASDLYTVPANQRLIIEFYSAQLTQAPAAGGTLYLTATAAGKTAYYKVAGPTTLLTPVNQMTKIYADPGTTVAATITENSGTTAGGTLIVSGHFVNLP